MTKKFDGGRGGCGVQPGGYLIFSKICHLYDLEKHQNDFYEKFFKQNFWETQGSRVCTLPQNQILLEANSEKIPNSELLNDNFD